MILNQFLIVLPGAVSNGRGGLGRYLRHLEHRDQQGYYPYGNEFTQGFYPYGQIAFFGWLVLSPEATVLQKTIIEYVSNPMSAFPFISIIHIFLRFMPHYSALFCCSKAFRNLDDTERFLFWSGNFVEVQRKLITGDDNWDTAVNCSLWLEHLVHFAYRKACLRHIVRNVTRELLQTHHDLLFYCLK